MKPLSFETISPLLRTGRIEIRGEETLYRRADDGHTTSFPKNHEIYLKKFVEGKSVATTIEELYAAGLRPVFSDLKNTLHRLYWAGDLRNARAFSTGIGMADWVPTENSALLTPLFEASYFHESSLMQLFILALSLGSICLAGFLFTTSHFATWALLLVPQAYFNLSFFVSVILNRLQGDSPFQVSWRVTPLGMFLEGDYAGHEAARARWVQFATGLTICFSLFVLLQGASISPEGAHMGVRLCALFVFLLLSPVHNSAISFSYGEKRGQRGSFFGHFLGAVTYGFLAFFIFFGVIRDLLSLFSSAPPLLAIGTAVFLLILGGVAVDLRDDLKFLRNLTREGEDERTRGKTAKESLSKRILSKTPVFNTLPESVVDRMASAAEVVRISRGLTICKEGQKSTDLYIVIKGRVGIYRKSEAAGKPHGGRSLIVELSAGSIFGEVGFFCGLPRTGDAVALDPAVLLRLQRPPASAGGGSGHGLDLEGPAMAAFQKKLWAFQALANSKLFSRIPSEILMTMVNVGSIVEAQESAVIMGEGSFPDSIWVLVQGSCKFTSPGKNARVLGPGEVLGEIGVIWNSLRTGTVATTGKCLFLRVDALSIRKLLSVNLNLALGLEELGQQRLERDFAA